MPHLTRTKTYACGSDAVNRARLVGVKCTEEEMEKVLLIVFVLSTQSSFTHDGEHPATGKNFDTIQWWLTQEEAFRISTFAKTNDIHIYQFDSALHPNQAIENTKKHYGDIIEAQYVLQIADAKDKENLKIIINEELGQGEIELIEKLNTGFWNYDGREYKTKTKP